MSDRIFGGIGILLAIFFAWQASLIEDSFLSDTVGPRIFPYIIASILGIASLVILLRPDAEPIWPGGAKLIELGMAVVVMIAYAELLPELGFLIASAFASAYLSWRLGTRPIMALVSGVGISVGIWVVFRLILGLSLAKGILGV